MTLDSPLVSIIVPIYNVQDYLEQCIESILGQSYSKIEVIAVDDGSTDEGLKILKSLKEKDSRLILISQENQGVSAARNKGIASASGEYLLFVDSDDYIEADMIEIMVGEAVEKPVDLVVCPYYSFLGSKRRTNNLMGGKVSITCNEDRLKLVASFFKNSGGYSFVVFNKMYRHELVKKHGITFEPTSEVFSEDTLFNFEFLQLVNSINVIDKPLYNYRIREGSIMNSYKSNLFERYSRLHDVLRKKLITSNYLSFVEKEFGKFTFYMNIIILGNERYSRVPFGKKLHIINKVSRPGLMRNTILKLNSKEYKFKRRAAFLLYRLRMPVAMYIMLLTVSKQPFM